jgi:beta-N-acetylhexosaminidase
MDDDKASTIALEQACGQLLFVGFDGLSLPADLAAAFGRGERGGAIFFRRNVALRDDGAVDVEAVARLASAIVSAAPPDLPPLIGVDQEGGRVARLGPPLRTVPPMRTLEGRPPLEVEALAFAVGRELAALGFNVDFAPVLDVDSNPDNPVIGDRSFGPDPARVAALGIAFVRGLSRAGVIACGKHFPGHGDTETDSHLALPRVRHPRTRLDELELRPFREAIAAGLPSVMTAHVVYDALDPATPATVSPKVLTDLLRGELGFAGLCISDDLHMRGISPGGGEDPEEIAAAAVAAVDAGCDLLLICHAGPGADAAHRALIERARADAVFERKVRRSVDRALAVRRRTPPRPIVDRAALAEIIAST